MPKSEPRKTKTVRTTALTLPKWIVQAETIEVQRNLQNFKKSAGLKFDRRKASTLQLLAIKHSEIFLKQIGKEPRPLFLKSVETVASAKTHAFDLKAHEVRSKKIRSSKFKINGSPVNWGSWRQFSASTDDSAARKEVFDDFLSKASLLTSLIRQKFDGSLEAMEEYGIDPLSLYLEVEKTSYDDLISFVGRIGLELKKPFQEALSIYSKEIMGREAEYYDDLYFFRSRIFKKYTNSSITKEDPVAKILSTMKQMGLDASRVKVDSANREGKSVSAFCESIKVPTDVRICYRKSNPLENFSSVFHEFGHGVHGVSIDPNAPFWDKYLIAMGVAEIVSIFFENLMHTKAYLTEELSMPDDVADDILSRYRFNELFFATFYAANSTMKLRYWKENLSMEEADNLYSDLTEKFMGIRYPGKYWQLHHVMPVYTMYSPSYMIASSRACQLAELLSSKFGEKYWREKGAGKFVLDLLRVGGSVDLSSLSPVLNPDILISKLGQLIESKC